MSKSGIINTIGHMRISGIQPLSAKQSIVQELVTITNAKNQLKTKG